MKNRLKTRGFTLIELLVVISIISILIGILVPALSGARRAAIAIVCGQQERQIGLGIQMSAMDNHNYLPLGAAFGAPPFDTMASNIIYLSGYVGIGKLLGEAKLDNTRAMFCPGDDSIDPVQENAKLSSGTSPVYTSYLYRGADETNSKQPRIDALGYNSLGLSYHASALLLDMNSLNTDVNFPSTYRTNHSNTLVNVLYADGHVERRSNEQDRYSIRAADYAGYPGDFTALEARINTIWQSADLQF